VRECGYNPSLYQLARVRAVPLPLVFFSSSLSLFLSLSLTAVSPRF
jgi:hypothetical protein